MKRATPLILLPLFIFCAWLVFASTSPDIPSPNAPPKIYSHPSKFDLRLTFLEAIKRSKKSIFLSIFGLTDQAFINLLSQKKIPLTIFYDKNGSPKISIENAALFPIYSKGLMHQKILVLDDEIVFIGSANFTKASLKMHDNLVIGFQDKEIATFLKKNAPLNSGYFEKILTWQKIQLWLLPETSALYELKSKIGSSRKSLQIALFTLTHPELVEEIIDAKKRGVVVTVILDLHSSLGASKSALNRLKSEGVKVLLSHGLQLMHHKFAYIDENELITGSANWTKSAFTKNHECLLFLTPLTRDQKRRMNNIWKILVARSN